ncbi:hypothetical protein M0813_29787 [Anaeramoeba flamelloides]|uniref:Uncharacterized protein n=1 Tax=Anaeramoeba flamelloides TaxID=1746091 RepID=A0ABQ8XLG9_9EUKA|nr:hypothetical protein M0813_29787 [Anaeramoeba flamelloides]
MDIPQEIEEYYLRNTNNKKVRDNDKMIKFLFSQIQQLEKKNSNVMKLFNELLDEVATMEGTNNKLINYFESKNKILEEQKSKHLKKNPKYDIFFLVHCHNNYLKNRILNLIKYLEDQPSLVKYNTSLVVYHENKISYEINSNNKNNSEHKPSNSENVNEYLKNKINGFGWKEKNRLLLFYPTAFNYNKTSKTFAQDHINILSDCVNTNNLTLIYSKCKSKDNVDKSIYFQKLQVLLKENSLIRFHQFKVYTVKPVENFRKNFFKILQDYQNNNEHIPNETTNQEINEQF